MFSNKKLFTKFLIIFSMLLILLSSLLCSVSNAFSSAEVLSVNSDVLLKVKSLDEYNSYNNYFIFKFGWSSIDCTPNYNVCFFNDVDDLKFYISYLKNNPTIFSNKAFDFVIYTLNANTYDVIDRVVNTNNTFTSHILNDNGYYRFSGNYSVYTDNTFSSFFFRAGVVLLEEMEVKEVPDKIRQVLIILVPLGLIIFGVLLVLFLLKLRS